MLTLSSITHKPTFRFCPVFNPKYIIKSRLEFLSSKSNFFGGFTSKTISSKKMTGIELIKTSALKSSSRKDEEDLSLLQEEAFVNMPTRALATRLEPTINRLSKWIVSGLFGGVIIWRHDPEAVWVVMGSVMNAILSVALKRILNQDRPVSTQRSDPGMPSSHAQSIFFIFVFVILSIVECLGINELSLTLSGLTLALASYLSWLRVSQQLHTISQVVVGATLGATFSILWYWSWNGIVEQAFDSLLWVQIIIYLGAAGFCLGFLLYVIKNWFRDDQ